MAALAYFGQFSESGISTICAIFIFHELSLAQYHRGYYKSF
jgi:hypothetical protein